MGDLDVGFAKLQGEDFEYYMQTYSFILGRNNTMSSVDVDLADLGGGKNISRHHARIFYDFEQKRFALEVLGRNGCYIEGVLYLPNDPSVKLHSQNLLQIGGKKFYFLLPTKKLSITPTSVSPTSGAASRKRPANPSKPAVSLKTGLDDPSLLLKNSKQVPTSGAASRKRPANLSKRALSRKTGLDDPSLLFQTSKEVPTSGAASRKRPANPSKRAVSLKTGLDDPSLLLQTAKEVPTSQATSRKRPANPSKPALSLNYGLDDPSLLSQTSKKVRASSKQEAGRDVAAGAGGGGRDKKSSSGGLGNEDHTATLSHSSIEDREVVSAITTVLLELCARGEWMPMARLHSELGDQYSDLVSQSKLRRVLESQDVNSVDGDTRVKVWAGLLVFLRKFPQYFVFNTKMKGRFRAEYVALVSDIM